jgi:cobalt-zinc-cadmium efflux system outer membrane protein
VLTIDDAARRATEASPLVRRARAEGGVVEARRVEADLFFPANPGVAGAVGPSRLRTAGGPAQSELGFRAHVDQALEVAGQRGARRAEVARAVDAAALRLTAAEVEARARARTAYVAALLTAAQVESARQREELAVELEASVRERVETGAASDIELALAALERSRIQRERLEARQTAADALAVLRALLGVAADAALALATPLDPPEAALPPLSALLGEAEQRRADLAALEARGGELDAAVVRLRREALPSPTLFLDVERDFPGELLLTAGVGVPLPVFRRRQGEIALARAERERVALERTLGAREVALEVERAFRAVETRRAQLRLDERELVPAATQALDLLTQGWRAGKFDLFRVIQASRESGEAHRRALEDAGRVWESRIELDRALGRP